MSNKQKAVWLMLLSTASMSIMQLIVKLSSGMFPTMQQVFVRNFVTLLIGAFLVMKHHEPLLGHKKNFLALLGRSVCGYIGVAGYFYATSNMNVADASLLHRSSPFFVIIFSAIFLKNRLKYVHIAALALAVAGSVLVINPAFNSNLFPFIIGVISAMGAGAAYVFINYLKGKESNATIIFVFSLVSCVLSAVTGGKDFVMPQGAGWLILLSIGVCAAIGQITLTQAYKMTDPGEVSIINYLGIAFSAIFGICFLNEAVRLHSLLGMICIFAAALLIYFKKDSKPITLRKK